MTKLNKKILLLVVEDEIILLNVLKERLMAEGFDVITALDGGEGLKLALAQHPDLILLDLLMPRVDGLMMLKSLRKDRWGAKANIIILTNVKDVDNEGGKLNIGLALGGSCEYMLKTNWSLDDVVARIKKKLGSE
ncbi:MAG: response regulator [Patescibacteria group bacterium]|jgi:two-component system alkaline phosphatase synthesis response regulator PhoP